MRKKKLLLITTTHLAKNPRLVKEIGTLYSEYQLTVVFFQLLPQYVKFDQEIIDKYPMVSFRPINWLRKYYPCRFFYTFLQKMLLLLWKSTGSFFFVEQLFFPGYWLLKRHCCKLSFDLIHGHNPGAWGVVVQMAKKRGVIGSFDIEDFHSGEYEANDPKKEILEAIENRYYKATHYLIAASPLIAKAYENKYSIAKCLVINNVFPKTQFTKREKLSLENPLKLVWFSQMVGPDRGLNEIIAALNLLNFEVELHLYGECSVSYQQQLQAELVGKHLLYFHGLRSNDALNHVLSNYDIGIASEIGHTENRDFCLTNKIFAYTQAGLSVLASDTAAQKVFLTQYSEIGYCYNRHQPEAIAAIITGLHQRRSILSHQQESAFQLGQKVLCWEEESIQLKNYFLGAFQAKTPSVPLKIAITVDPEIPVPPTLYGGIERIVYLLVEELSLRGHEITLFAHPLSKTSAKLIPWRGKSSPSFYSTIKNSLQLWFHFQKEHFDVIHSFSRLAYLSLLLPNVVAKLMSYQREPTPSQVRKAKFFSAAKSLRFTGCSDYIADQIKDIAPVSTIYNGINLDQYEFKNHVAKDAPLVFLGRIEEIKGTHLAIELARKTGHSLLIAGNIPLAGASYFKEKIAPELNNQIKYLGEVDDLQKNILLGQAAALVMPILWDEPFGIVMIEAMACGTPVIGLNRGALSEIVVPGLNGYIGENMDDLVLAVQQINLINRVKVRQHVEIYFSSTIIVNEYLALYQQIITACLKH